MRIPSFEEDPEESDEEDGMTNINKILFR